MPRMRFSSLFHSACCWPASRCCSAVPLGLLLAGEPLLLGQRFGHLGRPIADRFQFRLQHGPLLLPLRLPPPGFFQELFVLSVALGRRAVVRPFLLDFRQLRRGGGQPGELVPDGVLQLGPFPAQLIQELGDLSAAFQGGGRFLGVFVPGLFRLRRDGRALFLQVFSLAS